MLPLPASVCAPDTAGVVQSVAVLRQRAAVDVGIYPTVNRLLLPQPSTDSMAGGASRRRAAKAGSSGAGVSGVGGSGRQESLAEGSSTRDAIIGGGFGSRSSGADDEDRVPSEVDEWLVSSIRASAQPGPGRKAAGVGESDSGRNSDSDEEHQDDDDSGSGDILKGGADKSIESDAAAADAGSAESDGDNDTDEEERAIRRQHMERPIPKAMSDMQANFQDYSDLDFRSIKTSDIRIMDRTTRKVTKAGVAKYVAAFRGAGYRGFFGTVSVCRDPTRAKKYVLIDGGHRLSAMLVLQAEKHPKATEHMNACVITRLDKAPMTELDAVKLGAVANDAPTEAIAMSQCDHLHWARSFIYEFNHKFGNEAMDLSTNIDDLSRQVIALGIAPKVTSVNAEGGSKTIGVASVTKLMKLALLGEEDAASVDYIERCLTASQGRSRTGKAFSMEGLASPSLIYLPDIAAKQKSRIRLFMLQTAWEYTGGRDKDGKARRLKGGRDGRFYAHMLHYIRVIVDELDREKRLRRIHGRSRRSDELAVIDRRSTAMDILDQRRPQEKLKMADELAVLFIEDWTPDDVVSVAGKGSRDEASLVRRSLFCQQHLTSWRGKAGEFISGRAPPIVMKKGVKRPKVIEAGPSTETKGARGDLTSVGSDDGKAESGTQSGSSGGRSSQARSTSDVDVVDGDDGGGTDGGVGSGPKAIDENSGSQEKRRRPEPGHLKDGPGAITPKRKRKRSAKTMLGGHEFSDEAEQDDAAGAQPRKKHKPRAYISDWSATAGLDSSVKPLEKDLPPIHPARIEEACRCRASLLAAQPLPDFATLLPLQHQSYDFINLAEWRATEAAVDEYVLLNGIAMAGLPDGVTLRHLGRRARQLVTTASMSRYATTLIERGWVTLVGACLPPESAGTDDVESPVHSVLDVFAKTVPSERALASAAQSRAPDDVHHIWTPIHNIDHAIKDASALANGQGRLTVRVSEVRSQASDVKHQQYRLKLKADMLMAAVAWKLLSAVRAFEGRSGPVKVRAPEGGGRILLTTKDAPRQRPHVDSRVVIDETFPAPPDAAEDVATTIPQYGMPKTTNFFVLASGADPFVLCVWPGSVLALQRICQGHPFERVIPMEVVTVPPYSMAFCRGDLVHAGAAASDDKLRHNRAPVEFAYPRSVRIHMYLQDPDHPLENAIHTVDPYVFNSFSPSGELMHLDQVPQ